MQAAWRRRKILELLCVRRHIKIGELAKRFDVTSRTIYSDIEKLSLAYPIYTTSGRGSGGVHLMDDYTPAQHRLTAIIPTLPVEDQFIAESILQNFASI
mgnify:CR=1 FL=1